MQAKEHHPDSRTAGMEGEAVKFIELTEAYKRLTYESKTTSQGLHNVDRTGRHVNNLLVNIYRYKILISEITGYTRYRYRYRKLADLSGQVEHQPAIKYFITRLDLQYFFPLKFGYNSEHLN